MTRLLLIAALLAFVLWPSNGSGNDRRMAAAVDAAGIFAFAGLRHVEPAPEPPGPPKPTGEESPPVTPDVQPAPQPRPQPKPTYYQPRFRIFGR